MNELQIFNNEEFGSIRTVIVENEPWFVGKDVAEILGYSNTKDALSTHVDDDDKSIIQRSENTTFEIPNRGLTIINESGLYSLILSSKLPTAKKFKRWVTNEVLPSIRKHGAYMTPMTLEEAILNPDSAIKLLMALKEERDKNKTLKNEVAVQNQRILELQPKASYYDLVLNCKDLMSIGKIAKDYGWSATKMNSFLHDKQIQYKQGDIWLLYQKYSDKGYTSTKTHTYNGDDGKQHLRVHTYWTQKGRLFIYNLLKSSDILPLIERQKDNKTAV